MRHADEADRDIGTIPLWLAVLPLVTLIGLLVLNVWLYADNASYGPNQIALIIGAAIAALAGKSLGVPFPTILRGMVTSINSALSAILILLLIGGLTGTWMISGVVPAMIYYGLQILTPETFLLATVLVCSIVSLATGSSWTTIATVGVALIAIGRALGVSEPMTAGAIISGAYFGDKMSPLSDTTNLAPAMAGTDVFTHIRHMLWTTVPSYAVTLIVFWIFTRGLQVTASEASVDVLLAALASKFVISPWLLLVPGLVIAMVLLKFDAISALFVAMIAGAVVAVAVQPQVIAELSRELRYGNQATMAADRSTPPGDLGEDQVGETPPTSSAPVLAGRSVDYGIRAYYVSINAISATTALEVQAAELNARLADRGITGSRAEQLVAEFLENPKNSNLLSSRGMQGMLNTVWLVLCAMCFGGAMEAIGLLERLTLPLVHFARSTGSLIGTTVASCLLVNIAAADQYLAIVVPGRMFRKTFADRGIGPQTLSRTLEDSGTVTSVLIPWNTCGATQAGALKVQTLDYLPYCVFNYVSPLMSIFFGAFRIAIAKRIDTANGAAAAS